MLLRVFEYAFDLSLFWSAEYTERHLRQEINFIQEARNQERASKDFVQENYLAEHIYVPKVHWSYTTERIMTSEWIDGIALTDVPSLLKQGFNLGDIMQKVVSAFSYQIFQSGFVHGAFKWRGII